MDTAKTEGTQGELMEALVEAITNFHLVKPVGPGLVSSTLYLLHHLYLNLYKEDFNDICEP